MGFTRKFVSELGVPLYRNAYALAFSDMASSGLGLLYWFVAAHRYSAAQVGEGSAAISSMILVAGLAQLRLGGLMVRFLPRAGRATLKLIGSSYGICLTLGCLFAITFLAVSQRWLPRLNVGGGHTGLGIWFVLATMLWTIFAVQDNVLAGLRQTIFVPLENGLFGVAKIGLLVLFAAWQWSFGIFASWTLPVLLAVVGVNLLIGFRLGPGHAGATAELAVPLSLKQLGSYASSDYLSYLFSFVCVSVLPLMVTQVAGDRANGYFYLAWTVAYALHLVTRDMGVSLTVEIAADDSALAGYVRGMLRHILRLVVPATAIIFLGAGVILRIFGPDYSDHASTALRLLVLGAIPNVITMVYLSTERVLGRMRRVVALQAGLCVIVLGLGYVLLKRFGIGGVGLAWLTGQSITAGAVLVMRRKVLLLAMRMPDGAASSLSHMLGPAVSLKRALTRTLLWR